MVRPAGQSTCRRGSVRVAAPDGVRAAPRVDGGVRVPRG
jgi:hypothetical protein